MTEKKQINGPIGGQEQKALGQEDLEMSRHVTFMEAVKWAFVRNWGRQGITSIVTFILASILGPHDFGTVAIASVYIAFIQMLLGFGFDTAIIQRKDLKSLHVDSVFWVILIASILLAGGEYRVKQLVGESKSLARTCVGHLRAVAHNPDPGPDHRTAGFAFS